MNYDGCSEQWVFLVQGYCHEVCHVSFPNRPYPLYETDYLQWIETTVARLRSQDYEQVDWEHLIEEIEDMGRSERRALKSNLIIVLVHLLKWQYQLNHRNGSWQGSMIEHRRQVEEALQDSPRLQPYLQTIFGECYTQAVK